MQELIDYNREIQRKNQKLDDYNKEIQEVNQKFRNRYYNEKTKSETLEKELNFKIEEIKDLEDRLEIESNKADSMEEIVSKKNEEIKLLEERVEDLKEDIASASGTEIKKKEINMEERLCRLEELMKTKLGTQEETE